MDTSSLHFINRATNGDRLALDSLLAAHLDGLHHFVEKRAGDLLRQREAPSDLVQSACREALGSLHDYEYEGEAHFKAWLYKVALNKIIDKVRQLRAGKRDVARLRSLNQPAGGENSAALQLIDEQLSPSNLAIQREEMAQIEEALTRLPKDYRDVIVLGRFMGLPHGEIARHFGRSEGAVRVLLSRALSALRIELTQDGAGKGEE